MIASNTTLPVIGVPIPTSHLEGTDSLLSIVQMPKGIPVATFAIGEPGAVNAALYVISPRFPIGVETKYKTPLVSDYVIFFLENYLTYRKLYQYLLLRYLSAVENGWIYVRIPKL